MIPTSVSVTPLQTRRGKTLQEYALQLAGLLRILAYNAPTGSALLPNTLLVAPDAPATRTVSTIVPFDEVGPLARGIGEVMFPFGNDASGVRAAEEGLSIVKALGLNVLFYHTTWRNPGINSDVPELHISSDAVEVMRRIEKLAAEAGIRYHTIIEMADGVVDGALLRALTEHCVLIVTARGCNTGHGSYVDQWLEKSPIPMLVISRKENPQ